MRLILKDNNDVETEVMEIKTLNKDGDILFMFLNIMLRPKDVFDIETSLSERIGAKVILLDDKFLPQMFTK